MRVSTPLALLLQFIVGTSALAAKVDKQSLCSLESNGLPVTGPQVVVLYDLSDPYPVEVIQNLNTRLRAEISRLKPETRVTLFIFDRSKAFHSSVPYDSYCVAGEYSSFDVLAPNKTILAKRKKTESVRLEKFLTTNNPSVSTLGSPIIDAMVSAATSQTVTTVATDISVYVISDLVEYSQFANLNESPLSAARAGELAERIAPGIPKFSKVSKVVFLYVKREKYRSVQTKGLELFWRSLLDSRGIKSISFESIQ